MVLTRNTSTCRWASGRCGPSSPRPPRPARIPASSSTPTSSSSPSRACAGRSGSPATASSSPCPRSTTGSSLPAPCSASTTRARRAGRPTPRPRRPPTSTRTSRPRSTGSTSAARTSAPRATARAGTSPSGRRSTHACARTVCWYPTGLHDGKLGADKTDSLERAGDIDGDILLIFGTKDPHTPQPGRETIRRGLEAAGTRFIWSEYEAEHAFGRDIGPRYDPEATDRAFGETDDLPAPPPVILYDHPVSANCLKVRILLRAAGPGVRAGHDRPLQRRGAAAGAPRAQPGRARARARAGLRRADPGVGRDPALPGRGHATSCRPTGSSAPACTSGCSSSRTRSRRGWRSRASCGSPGRCRRSRRRSPTGCGRGATRCVRWSAGWWTTFVAGERYTVADIALYGYVHCAADADADPREYAAHRRLAGSRRGDAGVRERPRADSLDG